MGGRWAAHRLLAVVLAGLVVAARQAAPDQLEDKIKAASEAQEFGDEVTEVVKAKIVKEAPEAVLTSGTGDVATTGDCLGDIENFCEGVKPGQLALAHCLTNQQSQEEKGNIEGKRLTDDCKKELADFKIELGTNINKNIPLANACKDDVTELCKDADPSDPVPILVCLRTEKDKASQKCQEEIFKMQLEASKDYRADADLHASCGDDAQTFCKDVAPGEGRVQECLRDKAAAGQAVSWDCQEELFRQDMENAGDIRLSHRLYAKCMADKKKFCADVKPGMARVKDCLEEHRDDAGFGAECKEEFERMMEARAEDFRLDSSLREACASDIDSTCGYEQDSLDPVEGYDARVIQCLQDYKDELTTPACKQQVHKLTERASRDIRFDEPLADACFEDRVRLCPGVQAGSARVIRCLQDQREELQYACKATLFDAEVRMAEDIDFKYPLKLACAAEIGRFCAGTEKGQARVVRCLQDAADDPAMSFECRQEVVGDQNRAAQDYRLNYRLKAACEADIAALCGDVCPPTQGGVCGGRVLRCLTEKQESIKVRACADEVFYFEKMEVNDFRNDVLLAEACRTDVDRFCAKVERGEGRVHQCLRDHFGKLTEVCRKEELKLNILQSRDVRLRPKLTRACSEEMALYCKNVQPGKGRMFKCLQENVAAADFGGACREQVEKRGASMQEDYRLDYGVSSACEPDVQAKCAAEKSKAHGSAQVLKCLVRGYGGLAEACQREMSRAVRMALWEFRPGAALTGVCDADVDQVCQQAAANPKARGVWSIGAIGRCLSRTLAEGRALSLQCRQLVIAAAPKDAQAMFDSSMSAAAIAARIQELQAAAGITTPLINPAGRGADVVTLTGWVALAALVSLVLVVVGGVVVAYRRWAGLDKPLVVVTKQGDV